MTIRVKFTEQDLINAHMVIYFRKIYTLVLLGIIGLLFFSSLILGLIYERSLAVESLGYLVPVALLIGLQFILAKRRFTADRRYKEPVDYSFTNEGIGISDNRFDMLLPWGSVKKNHCNQKLDTHPTKVENHSSHSKGCLLGKRNRRIETASE